jgi:hypothetical protein
MELTMKIENTYNSFGPIVTNNVCPPIPIRSVDWEAWYDNLDEGGPVGRGATEQEAIIDLLNQEPL